MEEILNTIFEKVLNLRSQRWLFFSEKMEQIGPIISPVKLEGDQKYLFSLASDERDTGKKTQFFPPSV